MIAKHSVTKNVGKLIADTKRVYEWYFSFFGKDYKLTLIVSFGTKKYRVILNEDITLYEANRSVNKESFRYQFFLENQLLTIQQNEKNFDLLYQDKSFHSFLEHSIIHLIGNKLLLL